MSNIPCNLLIELNLEAFISFLGIIRIKLVILR